MVHVGVIVMVQVGKQKEYENLQLRPLAWDKVKGKLDMVRGWARNGLSDAQIATNLGIGETTIYHLKKDYTELEEALLDGRENAEIIVENAAFKRACGYKYKEVTKERQKVYDKDGKWTGEYEYVVTKSVLKEQAGDVGAQIYWLEHRAPKRWPKQMMPGLDPTDVNRQILGLAELLANPVKIREIGSELE